MLNQLLKFTLVSSLLIWLKPRWKGLLALCAAVILVHVIHGEYLGYVELSGERSLLLWSYVIKWTALLLAVGTYLFFLFFGARKRGAVSQHSRPAGVKAASAQPKPGSDDGFDFLRDKKSLQSRSEIIIASKPGKGPT